MVVWEGKTKSGAMVRIFDDYMAPKGSEQERRIIERQRRAAYEILSNAQRKDEESA